MRKILCSVCTTACRLCTTSAHARSLLNSRQKAIFALSSPKVCEKKREGNKGRASALLYSILTITPSPNGIAGASTYRTRPRALAVATVLLTQAAEALSAWVMQARADCVASSVASAMSSISTTARSPFDRQQEIARTYAGLVESGSGVQLSSEAGDAANLDELASSLPPLGSPAGDELFGWRPHRFGLVYLIDMLAGAARSTSICLLCSRALSEKHLSL